MIKNLLLTLILLLMVASPVMAISQSDIDRINTELFNSGITRPIEIEVPKSGWTIGDTTLLITRGIDWLQTRYIANDYTIIYNPSFNSQFFGKCPPLNNPPSYKTYNNSEVNPLLGKHPTEEIVDYYFAGLCSLDFLIWYKAKQDPEHWAKFKKYWQAIGIILEMGCITHNWQIGVGYKF